MQQIDYGYLKDNAILTNAQGQGRGVSEGALRCNPCVRASDLAPDSVRRGSLELENGDSTVRHDEEEETEEEEDEEEGDEEEEEGAEEEGEGLQEFRAGGLQRAGRRGTSSLMFWESGLQGAC